MPLLITAKKFFGTYLLGKLHTFRSFLLSYCLDNNNVTEANIFKLIIFRPTVTFAHTQRRDSNGFEKMNVQPKHNVSHSDTNDSSADDQQSANRKESTSTDGPTDDADALNVSNSFHNYCSPLLCLGLLVFACV